MTKPLYVANNNKDDMMEIRRQLHMLARDECAGWLVWCGRQCKPVAMVVNDNRAGMPNATFADFWNMVNDYKLDPEVPLQVLERLAKLQPKVRRQELHQLLSGQAPVPVPVLAWGAPKVLGGTTSMSTLGVAPGDNPKA